ncbi:uncharacterized protein [Physcomitrium patens]|uniref:FGGY carbohydrate kinase domain-containing protein n=2 Tax=Physcomitrium patens TaxID=3218 RepID=A0A2K1IJI7_PHYPA|nr:FGGY carbohydrate kinase domain-containing protein-like [Physcomitrium patens]PNR29437.1 hypothetical protein PHYPA_028130 [Physcomitrium patens]|eukprot:XP_024363138.1 FGGY carbohydrate kinase domain-containing protein-like [Physcomitrella patens]
MMESSPFLRNSSSIRQPKYDRTTLHNVSDGRQLFLGVDVGTGSARAGVFDGEGKLVGTANSPIQIWKDGKFVEQSSTDIWLAICTAVKSVCAKYRLNDYDICGIGFSATCSLVAIGTDDSPVSVSKTGDARRNVIVWMDHRAEEQAERINASKSPVLQFAGGSLSPEHQAPKLLWVKENLEESWAIAFRWMDLSDWLTFRATGDDTRSLCTTVCKWTYLGHAHLEQMSSKDSVAMKASGWDDLFWQEIGLGDLVESGYSTIGRNVAFPGHPLGLGLSHLAAQELGLKEGTPVATSLIDAHAGGIGTLESIPRSPGAVSGASDGTDALCQRMVLVCGTSTCHMVVSHERHFIPGVWGPFWSAMVPELWLTEGGQSATGALLDHIVETHPAAPALANRAAHQKLSIYDALNGILEDLAAEKNLPFQSALTKDIHVLPDFNGNRSPLADPKSRGVVSGLSLDASPEDLALLYLATVQSIAYGTKHLVEHCNAHGLKIDTLLACGGLSKNKLYIQEHANIVGFPVGLPRENEAVLLGAAVLGAVAAKKYSSVRDAMVALNAPGLVVEPSQDERVKKYHNAKYEIFRSLYEQQVSYRKTMAEALT